MLTPTRESSLHCMPRFARPRVHAAEGPSLPPLLPRKRAMIDRAIIAVTAAFAIWVLATRLSGALKYEALPTCPPAPPDWPSRLPAQELKVFSQNGEDGIIAHIFDNIGTTNKYYVEFGTEGGTECNTRLLRERKGWSGLLMDGGHENLTIGLHRELITPANINFLLAKYDVPQEFDLLSIDVDYDDWFVWRSIGSSNYRPRVVITEYNSGLPPDVRWVVDPGDSQRWPSSAGATNYYGASLKAFHDLGRHLGYTLVGCDADGVNAFFVRTEILECQGARVPSYAQLYVHASIHPAETNASRQWLVLGESLEEVGWVSAVGIPRQIE